MFDTFHVFKDVNDFADAIFDVLKVFSSFIFNFIKSIPTYLSYLIDFLVVYVIELPITLISMFGPLPTFVQTGLIVLLYAIYISFAFRLLKLIIPFL